MTAWLEYGLSNALAATALAIVALAVTRFARRPQLAFAAWLLVLAKLLVPPLVGLPLPSLRTPLPASEVPLVDFQPQRFGPASEAADGALIASPDRAVALEVAAVEVAASTIERSRFRELFALSPVGWLVAVWLLVSTCWLAVAVTRIARFGRVLARAQAAPFELEQEVRSLAERLHVRRVPRVKLARGRIPPLVWALFGRPVILLPVELLRALCDDERATLLAHELAHVKRRDHLARLLELAALCLYWWHPVAWWARRGAERAAEQCCDAEVVAHLPGASHPYAAALVKTVDFLSEARRPLPAGANGFSEASHVKRRLEMILHTAPVRCPRRSILLLILAAGIATLPLSLGALWAEPAAKFAEQSVSAEAASSNAEPKSAAGDAGQPAPTVDSIEQRLDRLEKMIESIATQVQADVTVAAPPKPGPNSIFDPRLFSGDLDTDLATILNEAKRHVEFAETNHSLRQAAFRQAEAVKKAYEADSVTMDQLLDAQSRLAKAEAKYVRTVCELCPDARRRRYVQAAANLIIGNKALNEARRTWQEVNVRYAHGSEENKDEAQAREQFYRYKSQAQELLDEFLEVARIRLLD